MAGTSGSTEQDSSSISSSSRAIFEGYTKYTREEVGPSLLADIRNAEECQVNQFLAVFLERCRNPATASIPQLGDNAHNDSPISGITVKQDSSDATTEYFSGPCAGDVVDVPAVSLEHFESCLQKISELCNNPEFRFNLADWRFDQELDYSILLRHDLANPVVPQPVKLAFSGKGGKLMIQLTLEDAKKQTEKEATKEAIEEMTKAADEKAANNKVTLHSVFNLMGRSTTVIKGTSTLGKPQSVVIKLYWPNRNRPHEAQIIDHAHKVPGTSDHLPQVLGSREIDSIGTQRIRDELGIRLASPRPSRSLRMIVFEPLSPITERKGNDFIYAWLECVRCHYLLWGAGIRHLDLSLANLMVGVRDVEGKPRYFGVVNDWDLGDEEEDQVESRKDLTKTILFTALDLLRSGPHNGQVIQRYSHDLESFLWILFWVFLVRPQEAKPLSESLALWRSADPRISRVARDSFFSTPLEYTLLEEWEHHWVMVKRIIKWWRPRIQDDLPDEDGMDGDEPDEDETSEGRKELLDMLLKIVKKSYNGEMPDSPAIEGL